VPIRVDLFDGKFTSRNPARLGRAESDLPGELIDQDFVHDLALVRIHPGRVIPASRVLSSDKSPVRGMSMYSLGCSNGEDPTAWDTVILEPLATTHDASKLPLPPPLKAEVVIKCAFQPREGREGGGLYTPDGILVGVCLFGDSNGQVGLYARPEYIRKLLDRNGLAEVHGRDVVRIALPQAKAEQRDPLLYSKIHRDSTAPQGEAEPALQAIPAKAASDQSNRLDDLERKLDQVLKTLEALKGDASSGQLKREARPDGLLKP
jgi:hypothetical protein